MPRTYPTFGQIKELTVNAAAGEGDDRYTAFETTFSKSYSHGWSLLGSYSIDRRDAQEHRSAQSERGALRHRGNDPGVWALPETYQGVRLSGTYELPWQMLVASTFTAQQGEYFNRVVQVRDALNTIVNVTVEGQAGRYDWVKLSDVRFSKSLRLKGGTLEGMFDVFNLFNSSVVLRRITTNGPNFNKPLSSGGIDAASANPIPAARVFRLSARYRSLRPGLPMGCTSPDHGNARSGAAPWLLVRPLTIRSSRRAFDSSSSSTRPRRNARGWRECALLQVSSRRPQRGRIAS